MIQSTKWYGLTSKSPEDYFRKNCQSYDDILTLLNRKGANIIRDIRPCIESFIEDSAHGVITDNFVDNLLVSNNDNLVDVANEAITYAIENVASAGDTNGNSMWYLWTDIPLLEKTYRTSTITDATTEVLRESLIECANRAASTLTTLDTDAINDAVSEFSSYVTYNDMMNWENARESLYTQSPISTYIGDTIYNMQKEDIWELANEGVMSDIDICLEEAASNLKHANPFTSGTQEGYRGLVNDIWSELLEANESTFASIAGNLYASRQMTITTESYVDTIKRMIKTGCLPALENITVDDLNSLMRDIDSKKFTPELSDITESMILEETNIIENNGKIYGIGRNLRDIEMMSFEYVSEGHNAYERGSVVRDAKHAVQKGTSKGKTGVSKAYAKYKNAEDDVDAKLTAMIKGCKGVVFGSENEARRQIVEGKGYSVLTTLKYIFGGYAIFSVSKVAFFLVLIARWCNSGKIQKAEKAKILAELEGELEILDQKIAYARQDDNRDAVYSLMRTRNNVKQAIVRIKRKSEAERGRGIGAGEVLLNKSRR